MPITPDARPATPGRKRISMAMLLDQMDAEWQTLLRDPQGRSEDEMGLLSHYHGSARVALQWIQGDYAYGFPTWYQGQRLVKVCEFLRAAEGKPKEELYPLRDRQVALLRTVSWPAYRDRCVAMTYRGQGGLKAELSYTWDGLDSLYGPDADHGPMDSPLPYLPKFHAPESEAWHCNVLAVVFLNRAVKLQLVDLDVTPF